ncbi:hypothetical protein AB7459_22555 [Providencia rettgeri]|uniref:hypothetical protein n=2 Tax=Morganellaceae TaxID=1903414 RepID=UPI001373FAB7|nr:MULTISPECIES: hypothetical protein [Providencia]EJD6474857.1 hypothetical protein [Providencia rettgeri]ELR5287698.1 hypothetical protein [Providencia rettgeri]ELR5294900.1 hypothetical protein [Providencia rettgeri]MBS0857794.1 hypothetical protein [Providencia rettgeri]MBS0871533.1 hypothetical protein [Providencia rettgeri]
MKIDNSFWLFLALFAVSWWATTLYDSNVLVKKDIERLENEATANQFILSTVLELSVTFNEISRNNLRERDAAAVASEKVKTIIKTVLVGNECAPLDAPSGATIELHNHANRIRSNAISTHSSPSTQ